MEELSAVGEQVFDAECILNKRLKKGKLEFLVKWRGWSSNKHLLTFFFLHREQEKELLIRKKGKRPRGRPRKIVVSKKQKLSDTKPSSSSSASSSSSDSSSSCSSSDSSSDGDDDDSSNVKQANPTGRTRDLHPVPQKKAQIVVAKQEPPKKRSKKPDVKEFQQSKGARKILKGSKDSDLPGVIKKPVHPASFTFMGFHRGSPRDTAAGQNRSSLTQGGAVKNSQSSVVSGRSVQPAASPSMNKSSQSRNVNEVNSAASKSKGVAALNLNTSKHPIQGTTQHTLSSPNGQKKPQTPVSTLQRIPNTKAMASISSKTAYSSQGSGLQPLNLQNKLVQRNNAPGNGTTPGSGLRNATNPARKTTVAQNQDALQKSTTEIQSQRERSASKDGKNAKMNDMSTGEDESSSDSDQDSSYTGQDRAGAIQNQDWKPTRSLIEHVFVTDVTANLVTVTVKESPTSVGFFSIRNY
uniref:Chromobox homolog 2 (Drosophila Pc class) n=1 Tax=Labrus bergylta TaxID=56723 RepID=A0A3Q3GZV9_9LABR